MNDTLLRIVEEIYFPLRAVRIASEDTRYQYRLAIRDFGKFLGRAPTAADLTDDTVSLWMAAMLRGDSQKGIRKLTPVTVRERAGRIGTLWEWMARRRMVDLFPAFDKPLAPEVSPFAMTGEQLRELFASAGRERGSICGIQACLWWQSFLLFILNSGERRSAALAIRCEWMDLKSKACLVPAGVRKGGLKAGRYCLWDKTVGMVGQCLAVNPQRELVWPWPKCEGAYYRTYDRILRDAGLPVTRHSKTHALRVTLGTWVKAFGGDPSAVLGHSDSATFEKHYNDRRITGAPPPDLSERFGLDF